MTMWQTTCRGAQRCRGALTWKNKNKHMHSRLSILIHLRYAFDDLSRFIFSYQILNIGIKFQGAHLGGSRGQPRAYINMWQTTERVAQRCWGALIWSNKYMHSFLSMLTHLRCVRAGAEGPCAQRPVPQARTSYATSSLTPSSTSSSPTTTQRCTIRFTKPCLRFHCETPRHGDCSNTRQLGGHQDGHQRDTYRVSIHIHGSRLTTNAVSNPEGCRQGVGGKCYDL